MFTDNISKKAFWKIVNIKINRAVHYYHVFSVISILFDEMIKDFISNKKIKIHNFGTFWLKTTNPRKYFDFRFQKLMQGKSNKIMQFSLDNKIKKKICKYIDIDKTFLDEHK